MRQHDASELAFRNGYEACLRDMHSRPKVGNTITFFDTVDELLYLTGLPTRAALWDAGFNLDDWDFGFVSETPWTDGEGWWNGNSSYYEHWMIQHMEDPDNYGHTKHNGKHYYLVYHS